MQDSNQDTDKRRAPRGALANASWNGFATLFGMVITFVMAPLLISRLGTNQWGLLLLVWSVTGVLGIANFGVGEATLRFVANYLAEKNMAGVNRVVGATVMFYLAICSLISGLIFGATPVIAGWVKVPADTSVSVESLLRLSALLFSFGMIANAFRCIPMALQRYDITSKVGMLQSIFRSVGILLLVLSGLGVMSVVAWEVLVSILALGVQIHIAKRLIPGLHSRPNFDAAAFREIFSYSVFSFLTHIFLMIYREIGKLIMGFRVGTAAVAYLGTPDSIAFRLHSVVVSGIETLMPRFSASGDPASARALAARATWAAIAAAVILYIPLAVLMPDFLRLWINAEFAANGGLVGQLLVAGFIGPVAFAPIATLFRGIGRPGFVTLVMAAAGLVVLGSTLMFVSSHGPVAVGLGYTFSALAWLGGLMGGWLHLYGPSSLSQLARIAGLPLLLGCALASLQIAFRQWWGEIGWIGLVTQGASFAAANGLLLFAADFLAGGESPATEILDRVLRSERIIALRRWVALGD